MTITAFLARIGAVIVAILLIVAALLWRGRAPEEPAVPDDEATTAAHAVADPATVDQVLTSTTDGS